MSTDQSSQLHSQLVRLVDAIKQALPGLPGFQSLEVYGSFGQGCSDAYSDIDAGVTTDDLPGAKARLLDVLEQVGPVEFCWEITLHSGEWVPTIAFRDESLYHRLDVKLRGTSDSSDLSALSDSNHAYVPPHGSMGHFLLGQYLGCLRYLKSRKRDQTMTCYRFASAAADWHLALRYARLTGDPTFRSKLSTSNYKELDRLLTVDDRDALLPSLDFSSPNAMDNTLRRAMDSMLKDALSLTAITGEAIPVPIFERISASVADELQST